MKCPACPTTSLVMTDRSGIEIDYCPDCRGVWLDRGELDKIIERATPVPPVGQLAPSARPYPADRPVPAGRQARVGRDFDEDDVGDFDDVDRPRHQHDYTSDGRPTSERRKRGLLGDLFDF